MSSVRTQPIDVLSLYGFLASLNRHRKKLIATFLIGAALSTAYVMVRGRDYSSSAKIFVRVGRETVSVDPTAEASGQVISVTDTQEREIRSIVSILSNRDLLEQLVDELGVYTILDFQEPGEEVSQEDESEDKMDLADKIAVLRGQVRSALESIGLLEEIDDREIAVQIVRDSLSIEAGDSSSVIKISARAESPTLAQMIVTKLLDLHLAYHVQANSTPGSLPFFSEQTDRLVGELEETSEELMAIKNKYNVASIEAKKNSLETHLLTLSERQTQAIADLASTISTIDEIEKQLSQESEMIPSAEMVGMTNSVKDVMRQELYQLQILESELLSRLKPTHPKLIDIRQQIEKARAVFDNEEQQVQTTNSTNVVHQQLRMSLMVERSKKAANEAMIDAIDKEVAELQINIANANQAELQLFALQRKVDLLDANYRRYVENLEQARIQKELEGQRISNVNIVQKPSYVNYPVGPSNLIILILGLIASFSAACAVAVMAEALTPMTPRTIRRSEPILVRTESANASENELSLETVEA
tara:strand:- start:11178 stop:12776 length:1599 start_codon:yes stop_codon:yes gene_type:complete